MLASHPKTGNEQMNTPWPMIIKTADLVSSYDLVLVLARVSRSADEGQAVVEIPVPEQSERPTGAGVSFQQELLLLDHLWGIHGGEDLLVGVCHPKGDQCGGSSSVLGDEGGQELWEMQVYNM